MKTTSQIFFMILLIFACIRVTAQDNQSSAGPVSNLKSEKINTLSGTESDLALVAYGYSSIQESTLSIPIPAGTPITFLANFTFPFPGGGTSMCKGGNGNFYIIEYFAPALYQFEPESGNIILLGTITGLNGDIPTGIAYNPANGMYYICSSTALYSFDLNTFTATFIGTFGIENIIMIDLCFDANGVCYAYDMNLDNAYILDINTATPTLLGPLGYNGNYGQGMSYDFETNTIYLSAFNIETQTGQLRTMDPITGSTTLITDWGLVQIAPFALDSNPEPCPVGPPENPYPVNGATGVSISGTTLSWTNGTGTTNVEVWFGPSGSVIQLYDGPAINSWFIDSLSYQTNYQWRIVCKNITCSKSGPFWSFTTESDSNVIFFDSFNNMNCWTQIGPFGMNNWSISNTNYAEGSPTSELRLNTWEPAFDGLSQLLSCPINDDAYHYIVKFRHMCDVYSSSSLVDLGIAITYDGGATKQILWQFQPTGGNVGPEEIETEFYPTSNNFQLIFFLDGHALYIENWYVDDLQVIDDCLPCFPPATPYNLTAQNISYPDPEVFLFWSDSAWNEDAFDIVRKDGEPNDPGQYELIGTVPADITYYVDSNVMTDSTYTYGVVAYNQYGYSDTSNTTTIVAEPIPVELISFYSEVNDNVVTLFWSTATETNNKEFEIEKASDNYDWTKIGFVEGKGTTTEIQNYYFKDKTDPGKYKYRLKQIDFDGTFKYSQEIEVEVLPPTIFLLKQNYPNPFNPITKITFQIPVPSYITLKVYDVLGNEVATLVNEEKPAGSYEVEFDATGLPSGIYFYKLQAGNYIGIKKMVILR